MSLRQLVLEDYLTDEQVETYFALEKLLPECARFAPSTARYIEQMIKDGNTDYISWYDLAEEIFELYCDPRYPEKDLDKYYTAAFLAKYIFQTFCDYSPLLDFIDFNIFNIDCEHTPDCGHPDHDKYIVLKYMDEC